MKTFADYRIDLMGKQGVEVKVLCPECSHSRKKNKIKDLSVNTETGVWFCHHCGWSGGLKHKRPIYSIPEFAYDAQLDESVIIWFKKRGIGVGTLESMKVAYGAIWMPSTGKEENAIQFPYYKNGTVVNIKYRDGRKNFRQAKNAEKCFYGFDRMKNESDTLIITEGEIDTLSFIEAGFDEVVSMPDGAPPANANSYTTKFSFMDSAADKIEKYDRVILAVDDDAPGKLAGKELSRRIGPEKCYSVVYPEGSKDANEVLVKHGRKAVKDLVKNCKGYPVNGLFTASDFKDQVLDLYHNGAGKSYSTGWNGIDKYYTCRPGELTIVTGMPGSGKSNWLDCLMFNLISESDWKFAVFSPENWPVERHIATLSEKVMGRPFARSFGENFKRMSPSEVEEACFLVEDNISFMQPNDDEVGATVDTILKLAKVALLRHGIKGLIIDPWNEISHDFGKLTETQYISQELGKIRRFGRLNGVHIFLVAHPQKQQKNAQGKYDPPTMYSISGGAHFNNKADNGICVHRLYEEGKRCHTQIHIQKIRFRDIGTPGGYTLNYQPATALYKDDLPDGRISNEKNNDWD